jgi:hypothetical protein
MNDTTTPATLPKSLVDTLPSSAGIAKQIDVLVAALVALDREMLAQCKKGAVPAARSFVVLRRLKDKFEGLDKSFKALYTQYAVERIPELFEAEGVPHVPLAEGYRVGVSNKFYASIKEGMRDKGWAWLKKHGLSALITETVNSSSLSAAIKHEIEENNLEPPADLFTTAWVPNTSVTKT